MRSGSLGNEEITALLIDGGNTPLTAEESTALEMQFNSLYWQSWKYFGLKIAIPFIPLLISGTLIGVFIQAYPNEDEEKKEKAIRDMAIDGAGGLLAFGLLARCFSKDLHERQKKIDEELDSVKEKMRRCIKK